MAVLTAAFFTDRDRRMGDPIDDAYGQRNFDLCRAIDINALTVVLMDMVDAGMPKPQADCFRAQADALLQLVRTENNRIRAQQHAKTDPSHD